MDVAAKKRRLDRELGVDDGSEPLEENADRANAMLLTAQNRALSTNLFVYKRKISRLESDASQKTKKLEALEAFIHVLGRKLEQFEHDLVMVASAKHANISAEDFDIITNTVEWHGLPNVQAYIARLTKTEACSGGAPASQVDAAMSNRLQTITRVTTSLLSTAIDNGADSTVVDTIDRTRAAQAEVQGLQELLCSERAHLESVSGQLRAAEERNKDLERLIERLKYDHPDLDIDAHSKHVAPHGMDIGSGMGSVPLKPQHEVSMAGDHADISGVTQPIMTVDTHITATAAAATHQASADAEDLEIAKEELEVYRALLDDLRSEVADIRQKSLAVSSENEMLRSYKVSVDDVMVSPLYLQRCKDLDAVKAQLEASSESQSRLQTELDTYTQRLRHIEQENMELKKSLANGDDHFRQSIQQQLSAFDEQVSTLTLAKHKAVEQLAVLSAEASSANALRQQVEDLSKLMKQLEQAQSHWRQDWFSVVSANPAVAQALADVRANPTGETAAAAELASLTEEKSQLMTMVASISTEYECALSDLVSRQESVTAKDAEIARLQGDLQRAHADRSLADSARTALESQVISSQDAFNASQETLNQQNKLIEQIKEQCREKESKLAVATADLNTLRQRLDKASEPVRTLRAQVEALERQRQELADRVQTLVQEMDTASTALGRANEENVELQKRLQQKEAKFSKLKEKWSTRLELDSPSPFTMDAPRLSRSVSTPIDGGDMLAKMKENLEMSSKLVICSVCNLHQKNTVIIKCGHLFCRHCIEERVKVRSRKCPACANPFSNEDVRPVYFA